MPNTTKETTNTSNDSILETYWECHCKRKVEIIINSMESSLPGNFIRFSKLICRCGIIDAYLTLLPIALYITLVFQSKVIITHFFNFILVLFFFPHTRNQMTCRNQVQAGPNTNHSNDCISLISVNGPRETLNGPLEWFVISGETGHKSIK